MLVGRIVLCTTIFTKFTESVQQQGVEVINTAAMTTRMVEEEVMLRERSTMCPKATCVFTSETNKPESVTQQSQPFSDNRGCAAYVVNKFSVARLAHTTREEDHRETIRACCQATQKGTIGRAHAELHRDDNPRAFDCCVSTAYSPCGRFQFRANWMDVVCSDASQSRRPPDVVYKWNEVTCLLHHLSELKFPRIRKDRALQEFYSNSDKMHRTPLDDQYTQEWFGFFRSSFPQSLRNTGTIVDIYNVPMYQCCIFFNNMCDFYWNSEFRKPAVLNKPSDKEKNKIADVSLLKEFWWNNYAHLIWTAEADNLPTNEKQLLADYGLMGFDSSRSNDLSVHARIVSTGMSGSCGNQMKTTNVNTHAAMDVKFGSKSEGAIAVSSKRTADMLCNDLESVAMVIEGTNSDSLKTISYLRPTASKTPRRGNWPPGPVFKDYGVVYAISTTSRQWLYLLLFDSFSERSIRGYTISRSMSLLEMPTWQKYRYFKRQKCQDLHMSSVAIMLREMQREVKYGTRIWKQASLWLFHQSWLWSASLSKWSWLLLHGCSLLGKKTTRTQKSK